MALPLPLKAGARAENRRCFAAINPDPSFTDSYCVIFFFTTKPIRVFAFNYMTVDKMATCARDRVAHII